MTLTLEQIEAWDSDAIRSVSSAMANRGATTAEVRDGLNRLPLSTIWQGTTADAASASMAKLSVRKVEALVVELERESIKLVDALHSSRADAPFCRCC